MTTWVMETLALVDHARVRGRVSTLPTAEQFRLAVWPKGMVMEEAGVVVTLREEPLVQKDETQVHVHALS